MNFINRILYDLKKQYGKPGVLYKVKTVNDLETGQKIVTRKRYDLGKIIPLPQSYITTKIYALSYIAANKNFTYGAFFNKNTKVFLIDNPNIDIASEDYLVVENRRYEIKNIEELELNVGYIIIGENVQGVGTGAIYEVSINDYIRFAHRAVEND